MSKRNDDDAVPELLCTARREAILERIEGLEGTMTERIDGIKKAIYISSTVVALVIAVLEVLLNFA